MAGRRYRIVLRGRLGKRFESAFDGMALEPGRGQTVLVGEVRDQAHLFGLLDRLRDFGIDLVAVEPADTPDAGAGPGAPQTRVVEPPSGQANGKRRQGSV